MTPVCIAATISWALFYGDAPADGCFGDKGYCEIAALYANNAFQISARKHNEQVDPDFAHCVEQPAGDPLHPPMHIWSPNLDRARP